MATVFIEDLKVDTVIGLCEWEKHVKQTLHFDIDMQVDIDGAADGDNIDATVDYAAVAQQVIDFTQAQSCLLIETLLESLLKHLLDNHERISEITITLRKPQAIPAAACAGITSSLSRQ